MHDFDAGCHDCHCYGSTVYHRLYVHLVWTTRDREPLIDAGIAGFLCRFLRAVARKERSYVLEIGIVQTHVHLLVRTHPTVNISRLVQRLKALSATVRNKEHHCDWSVPLYWAKGYAVKSVAPEGLDAIRAYLRHQPKHHPAEAILSWPGDTGAEYDASSPGMFSRQNPPNKVAPSDDVPSSDASRGDDVPSSGASREQGLGLRSPRDCLESLNSPVGTEQPRARFSVSLGTSFMLEIRSRPPGGTAP